MKKTLPKFRVATPLRSGILVAATSPELAVRALLPDSEFSLKREGRGWFMFEVTEPLPNGWPFEPTLGDSTDFGTVIDVEQAGTILIIEEDDEDAESDGDS